MTDHELLMVFLREFVWADDDWLVVPGEGVAVYWQSEQAIRISVKSDEASGLAKWRVSIVFVEQARNREAALQLCLALNKWNCGWSFAFDDESGTLLALAAMSGPRDWDPQVLRLSETIKHAGFMCQVLAQWAAEQVGGTVARSWPDHKDGPREVPDATHFYSRSLRARPEWVWDFSWWKYPPLDEVAEFFACQVGAPADTTKVYSDHFRIVRNATDEVLPTFVLIGGFTLNPVFGWGWSLDMLVPGLPAVHAAELANDMAWLQFEDHTMDLLGAWELSSQGLAFRVFATCSELRRYERLVSFIGHDARELWLISSSAISALKVSGAIDLSGYAGLPVIPQRQELVREAITQITCLAGDLDKVHGDESVADRRLLWLGIGELLLTAVWFNPIGPTCSTIETGFDARGRKFLIHLRRHPFVPRYEVIAEVTDVDSVVAALPEALSRVFSTSPTVLDFEGCPAEYLDHVVTLVKPTLRQNESRDFGEKAAQLEAADGNLWSYASPRDLLPPFNDYSHLPDDEKFDLWWQIATDEDNVRATLTQLPDAWDGAVNYQMQSGAGESGVFDMEPIMVTYSNIGFIDEP